MAFAADLFCNLTVVFAGLSQTHMAFAGNWFLHEGSCQPRAREGMGQSMTGCSLLFTRKWGQRNKSGLR